MPCRECGSKVSCRNDATWVFSYAGHCPALLCALLWLCSAPNAWAVDSTGGQARPQHCTYRPAKHLYFLYQPPDPVQLDHIKHAYQL